MRISLIKLTTVIPLVFLLCISWAQEIEIKTENGITVVHNPKKPVSLPGVPSTVILKQDLIIGEDTRKEDHWFSFLNSLAVDDSGNIYTLDPKEVKIRVFDSKGKLLRTFGRIGQGPGEFRGPGRMKIMSDGVLVVYDVLSRRFTYLTLDGKFLKTVSASKLPMGSFRIDSRGFVYQYKRGRGNKIVKELIKYDPDLNPIMKFHSFEKKRKRGVSNPFPEGYHFDLTVDDHLIWNLSSTYDMHVVDPNGKTVKRIVKDYDPVKITDSDKEPFIKKESSQEAPFRFKLEFPEYYPVVSALFIDDYNRIYAKTSERDENGGVYYDVFDPMGRYISRFSLPENEQVYVVKNNKLYCIIRESEEGIPLVKRYIMGWK
ncbi:6-bladed beta-propeller [bacterium]|nr:6-bladed beta-propeller [bacterium]